MFWSYLSLTQTQNQAPFFFHGLLIIQGIFSQNFIFFLNQIDQLETVHPVHRASLHGALIFVILVLKSYMDRDHKPQISPRHGLDLVLYHVMGFLQPTLGPLGYLVVKERSKCGQLWTLGIEECL